MRPELQPLWDVGVDVDFHCYMIDQILEPLRQAFPQVADIRSILGLQRLATVNLGRGVWTSCVLSLLPTASHDDVARRASALVAMPSLRRITIDLAQLTEYEWFDDAPSFEYDDAPFPAAVGRQLWSALAASHVLDVTLLGGNLLATPDGVRSAIQFLAHRPLRRLCLDDVQHKADHVAALVTAVRDCTTLSAIELSYDLMFLPAFLSAPLPRHLRRLRLFVSSMPVRSESDWCDISAISIELVASGIADSALTHLSLAVDRLDDRGVATLLLTALEKMPCLTHLELFHVRHGPLLNAVLATHATRIAALASMQLHGLEALESQESDVEPMDMFGAADY
ncbi:hypothetical protein SPRG_22361 [Saprolegnia parasitica CBS 223.65]|uniref:F-box domain-containing protein n=1 Tax=Saprolegnia parasitica (strain CBS 223.65) TaxID=695850 RepID=A0A067BKN9_SAPPC|nr:hypothetical protein SPRG_22361 [Saprolegnia parasitica CBS 223.65]KDO18738.1 hypothetical protein SPRG_22361 [Saprolegnia parasitica CBS 223.65]|eukprot:XP_012210564.1 hypothetical protein SPRG_22361 [Saprolegnia parasitica CBS 223.65]